MSEPWKTRLARLSAGRVPAPAAEESSIPHAHGGRVLRWASLAAVLVGSLFAAYPRLTDLWAARVQEGLRGELAAMGQPARDAAIGSPVTRLRIPRLSVDVVVVEGIDDAALRAGAGHYPRSALPGETGNVAIAGHRTTYGKPFNRMDELRLGDRIVLSDPKGSYTYRVVRKPWPVSPFDWAPIRHFPRGAAVLTLTSCHPEGSDARRIIVRARLESAPRVDNERSPWMRQPGGRPMGGSNV